MSKSGPIIIIDDDQEDVFILEEILQAQNRKNQIIKFNETSSAFDYLRETSSKPFLIFCDINMPKQNGLEFKRSIDSDPELRKKSIPFILLSTGSRPEYVNTAYSELTVQGYFLKDRDYNQAKVTIKKILEYWDACEHPFTE